MITLIILLVLILFGLLKSADLVSVQSGEFLSSCANSLCKEGLICDPTSFLCKLGIGSKCTNSNQCSYGLFCSGVCTIGPTGDIGNFCPCKEKLICLPQEDNTKRCLGLSGSSCNSDRECASSICMNNTCVSAPNSYPCKFNIQCSSGNCSKGFCQNKGIISGTIGSACSGNCVKFSGSECKNSECKCLNGLDEPGTCVNATQGILSPCSINNFCSLDLLCVNGTDGNLCNTSNCLCSFPYFDVNKWVPGTECIFGMVSDSARCLNNTGLGCDNNNMCISNKCEGSSVMVVYQFGTVQNKNTKTNFFGSTSTSILPAALFHGNVTPYKMFSTTEGDVDTIYLVCSQGLYSVQYNPISHTIVNPWKLLLPYKTIVGNTTRILIDASVNSNGFIIAFHETFKTNTTEIHNDTVYTGSIDHLVPFNVHGQGLSGTQYDQSMNPLSIEFIDVSQSNDVLIAYQGTVYIKPSALTYYFVGKISGGPQNGFEMRGFTGPVRFYNNEGISYENIAFIKDFELSGKYFEQVLRFSGNDTIAWVAIPIDRFGNNVQYKVFDFSIVSGDEGITNASAIMLTSVSYHNNFVGNMVALNFKGITTIVPYNISSNCRCVVTPNAYYIFSPSSCL